MKKNSLKNFTESLKRSEMRSINGGTRELIDADGGDTCTCSGIGQACGGSCAGRTCTYSTEMKSYFCKLG